jgi:hypothetical protein
MCLIHNSPYTVSITWVYYVFVLTTLGEILWCIFYAFDLQIVSSTLLFHIAYFTPTILRRFNKNPFPADGSFIDASIHVMLYFSISLLSSWSYCASFSQLRILLQSNLTMSEQDFQFLTIFLVSIQIIKVSVQEMDYVGPLVALWYIIALPASDLTRSSSPFFFILFLSFSLVTFLLRLFSDSFKLL